MDTIEVKSCIRGHHVYSSIWTPVLHELLTCQRELDNAEDKYAVAVRKGEGIVSTGIFERWQRGLCPS